MELGCLSLPKLLFMHLLRFILLFWLLPTIGFGQSRQVLLGEYESEVSIANSRIDNDGYMIHVGTYFKPNSNLLIVKTDKAGNVLWSRSRAPVGGEMGWRVRVAANGDYLIMSSGPMTVTRVDPSGNLLWSKKLSFSTDAGAPRSITETSDGNIIICGQHDFFPAGLSQFEGFLIALDAAGVVQWAKSYGHSQLIADDYIFNDVACVGNEIWVAGEFNEGGSFQQRGLVMKFDLNGDLLAGRILASLQNVNGENLQSYVFKDLSVREGRIFLNGRADTVGGLAYSTHQLIARLDTAAFSLNAMILSSGNSPYLGLPGFFVKDTNVIYSCLTTLSGTAGGWRRSLITKLMGGAIVSVKQKNLDSFFLVNSINVAGDTVITTGRTNFESKGYFSNFCETEVAGTCYHTDTVVQLGNFSANLDTTFYAPVVTSRLVTEVIPPPLLVRCIFETHVCGTASCPPAMAATIIPLTATTVCDTALLYTESCYLKQWFRDNNLLPETGPTLAATVSGSYTLVVGNGLCSDTSQPLVLQVHNSPLPIITQQSATTLESSPAVAYQWLDQSQSPIPGATQQTFNPVSGGIYYAKVIDANGCTGISAGFLFTPTGVSALAATQGLLQLFPNPARDRFSVNNGTSGAVSVSFYSIDGKQLKTVRQKKGIAGYNSMDIDLGEGIYLVVIKGDTTAVRDKLVILGGSD
jgi:hypothetical protein